MLPSIHRAFAKSVSGRERLVFYTLFYTVRHGYRNLSFISINRPSWQKIFHSERLLPNFGLYSPRSVPLAVRQMTQDSVEVQCIENSGTRAQASR